MMSEASGLQKRLTSPKRRKIGGLGRVKRDDGTFSARNGRLSFVVLKMLGDDR